MRRLGQVLKNTIFWSYERGSWPYDVFVVLIVVFVLLSPRSWFHDQPRVGAFAEVARVDLLAEDAAERRMTYRLDVRLLSQRYQNWEAYELEHETRRALERHVEALRDRDFHIERVEAVFDEQGAVLYYDVTVRP